MKQCAIGVREGETMLLISDRKGLKTMVKGGDLLRMLSIFVIKLFFCKIFIKQAACFC